MTLPTATRVEPPFCRLTTPDHYYLTGEAISLRCYPPESARFEIHINNARGDLFTEATIDDPRFDLPDGLPAGRYVVRVRCATDDGWSEWSARGELIVDTPDNADQVEERRRWAHLHSLVASRDVHGILTITDPWRLPPSCPTENVKWFRTPVYEGASTLLNETASYYRDPLRYLFDAVQTLRTRGARFVTWHDVIDRRIGVEPLEVILQFDVDAGRHSIGRIIPPLLEMGVRATAMIHRAAHDWYEYDFTQLPLETLRKAEEAGWTIGYHQNAISNAQRLERAGDYGPAVMDDARQCFHDDVAALRQHFDIRTVTAHGGNVVNRRLGVPQDADVVDVDRTNAPLWEPITGMFSDGGFQSRPGPLSEKVAEERPGLFFFRLHPFKYGNYESPWDAPPIDLEEASARGIDVTDELTAWRDREYAKQRTWLDHRRTHRLGRMLSYANEGHPISDAFAPAEAIAEPIDRFRGRRRPYFLREYPAPLADPRVFWWRMLHAHVPRVDGVNVLNVGAMPPGRRDETNDFLVPSATVTELDVDASREPHLLGDITEPPAEIHRRFDAVLLFGLGCVQSPSLGTQGCLAAARPGGVGLFGFPDDTHPIRGAMWNGSSRVLWRRDREPLDDIGLNQNLWSFDDVCLEDLFAGWADVRIENHSHYWFVVARRPE